MSSDAPTPPRTASGASTPDQAPAVEEHPATDVTAGEPAGGHGVAGPGKFADPSYVEETYELSDPTDSDTSTERSVRTSDPEAPEPPGVIAPGVGAAPPNP